MKYPPYLFFWNLLSVHIVKPIIYDTDESGFFHSMDLLHVIWRDLTNITAGSASSVGCAATWYADSCGFDPPVRQHSFVEISHEIISTAILPLPLIQVGLLSVTGKRKCTMYWLTT